MKLAEFIQAGPNGGTIFINPANICACVPYFGKNDDVWEYTEIHMSGGAVFNVNASLEQIEETLASAGQKQAPFDAR